jgi:hypothetical protein
VLFTLVGKVVSFTLFLLLPFYKLVLLFTIVVGAMNFMLLKFFASKSSSLLFMFIVETHFSSFL